MSITKLLYGDCMKWLPKLPEGQTSLVLADLPNMMEAEYDKNIIPLPELWQEYKRILKPGGIVALFASQPFTTKLINSNPTWLKNCWYWEKVQPMRRIEEILIFQDPNAVHKAIRYQNKIDNFIYPNRRKTPSFSYGDIRRVSFAGSMPVKDTIQRR